MSTWTNSWSDPVQRAAVWYLAAFAALASVLLTGTQLSGFVWGRATHPEWAAALVGLSVAAAAGVVGLAANVLTPTFELTDLKRRQQHAEEAIKEGDDSGWRAIAAQDSRVLEPLYAVDGFEGVNDSPIQLGRLAREGPVQAQRVNEMVAAANRRAAARYFRILRVGAPFALGLVLATALVWPTLSQTGTPGCVGRKSGACATRAPTRRPASECHRRRLQPHDLAGSRDLRRRPDHVFDRTASAG